MELIGPDGRPLPRKRILIDASDLAILLAGLMLVADERERLAMTPLAKRQPVRRAHLRGEANGIRACVERISETFGLTDKRKTAQSETGQMEPVDADEGGEGRSEEDEERREVVRLHREALRRQAAGGGSVVPDPGAAEREATPAAGTLPSKQGDPEQD